MVARWMFPVALLLVAGLPASAEVPNEIARIAEEGQAECRAAGGKPTIMPEFQTAADLNRDGIDDYIVNFAGLECANAWSYFCGSAGCPVSVWLSGPAGHDTAWSGYAQAVDVGAGRVTVYLHGQFCNPPRVGSDGCEEILSFDAPAAAGGDTAAEPPLAPVPPSRLSWELRQPPGSPAVAVVGGPGTLRSMAAFCLAGQPWLALVFDPPPDQDRVQLILLIVLNLYF